MLRVDEDLNCSFILLKSNSPEEFKINLLTTFDIGNPETHYFMKPHFHKLKCKKHRLVEKEKEYAKEF